MRSLASACVIALVLLVGGQKAEAKGFFLINTGEDVVEIGDVKPDLKAQVEAETQPGVKVGMMYSRFGVFWQDIWRWNKKYVLFKDTTFWEIDEKKATAMAVSISKPITMTIPPGLIILILLGGAFAVYTVVSKKKNSDAPPPPTAG